MVLVKVKMKSQVNKKGSGFFEYLGECRPLMNVSDFIVSSTKVC